MFTECPACQTMFRVTGAILRAGHGQVECGQCHTIFDAIERLVDDTPPEMPTIATEGSPLLPPEPVSAEPELPGATAPWVNDLPTGEFVLKDGELIPVGTRPEGKPTLEPVAPQIVVEEPGFPEEITLEGDRIEISGVYRAPDSLPEPSETEPLLDPLDAGDESSTSRAQDEPQRYFDSELASEEPRRRTAAWATLSLVLLLAFGLQAVHHYRQELVRHPRLGPALLQAYAAVGLPLAPNWDVTGYEVQQWGVAADPTATETLRLRASIMNRAGFAQPYPLIKLTLEDRWGEQVGAREFEPREYLGPGVAADRLLAPNQRVNADIGIVDPGADAVGFHVDVCLPTQGGSECSGQRRQQ